MNENSRDFSVLIDEEIYYIPCFNNPKRINLEVPFKDKDKVKIMGAQWDYVIRKWFIDTSRIDPEKFKEYIPKEKITYTRTKTKYYEKIMTPRQVYNAQASMELTNEQFAELLCISEEELVKVKKGEIDIPVHSNRILRFTRSTADYYTTDALYPFYETIAIESEYTP